MSDAVVISLIGAVATTVTALIGLYAARDARSMAAKSLTATAGNQSAIEQVDAKVDQVKEQTNGMLAVATTHASELGQVRGEAEAARKAAELAVIKAEEMAKIATALALKESKLAVAAAEERTPTSLMPTTDATVRVADATEELVKETARAADAQEAALPVKQTSESEKEQR